METSSVGVAPDFVDTCMAPPTTPSIPPITPIIPPTKRYEEIAPIIPVTSTMKPFSTRDIAEPQEAIRAIPPIAIRAGRGYNLRFGSIKRRAVGKLRIRPAKTRKPPITETARPAFIFSKSRLQVLPLVSCMFKV
jgi:hypothetical protein